MDGVWVAPGVSRTAARLTPVTGLTTLKVELSPAVMLSAPSVPGELAEGVGVPSEPGSEVEESVTLGDGSVVGVAESVGVIDGEVLAVAGGVELPDVLGVGLALPDGVVPGLLHRDDAAGLPAAVPDGPAEWPPLARWEAECAAAWAELPVAACWVQGSEMEPVDEIACGSVITARMPAAITKIAVPIAAAGRSQPYRDLACPDGSSGRNRSTVAQKMSSSESMTGSAQLTKRRVVSAYQSEIMANEISDGGASRSLIRSSPSGDGSIDSAALCSARRSTSS